jgi:ATP-dependent helicase HepA
MSQYIPGQRYMSQTEPELGLGLIVSVESKVIAVLFRAAGDKRTYGIATAPLKRVSFDVGEKILTDTGDELLVDQVENVDGLLIYLCQDRAVPESQLADAQAFSRPEERLFAGHSDSAALFHLRLETLEHRRKLASSPLKGLIGARMALIPHQLYIASEVAKREHPRVLLADEVGLGKTIEAGLIVHQMLASGRAARVLVLVPDSLVYQWLLEMRRRFNLQFAPVNQEIPLDPGTNPFVDNQLVVASLGLLKGAPLARELLARADFDILVVDEAHQIKWSVEKESPEYTIVSGLSEKIASVLLLTATPEQLGLEGHFARLRLLDANRFHDYQLFSKEAREYGVVAKLAERLRNGEGPGGASDEVLDRYLGVELRQELERTPTDKNLIERAVSEMVDRHGTGRVFFRNTRQALGDESRFFPVRLLHPHPLQYAGKQAIETHADREARGPLFAEKAMWLVDFCRKMEGHKILLICHGKDMVLELERLLKEGVSGIKTGVFHSGLSLMARDRQAAYFSEPDGAQILLCTEIGSEGRNFQFAQHLVLFDLPSKPDLLEQRIGRLDRIGQKGRVNIHVPYVEKTWEERLFSWFHRGLNAFEKPLGAGTVLYRIFRQELTEYLDAKVIDESKLENFLEQVRREKDELYKKIEEGRDLLIELNSFNAERANLIVANAKEQDRNEDLSNYMGRVFEALGVEEEDLDGTSLYIRPGDNMFVPHFPNLPHEGKTVTYERSRALEREDVDFLTWDNPMVSGVMELFLAEPYGNVTVATRKEATGQKKSFVEAFFVVRLQAPAYLQADRYFPPTIVRVMVDKEGEDFAEKWSFTELSSKLVQADKEGLERARAVPKEFLKGLLAKAEIKAQEKARVVAGQAREKMLNSMNGEIERLKTLMKVNPSVRAEEITFTEEKRDALLSLMERSSVALESFRLIL